jgi:hypothetical protein
MMHFIYKWLKQCRFFLRLRIAAEVSSGDPSQSDIQLATPYGGVEEFANWAPTQVAGQNTSRFHEPFLYVRLVTMINLPSQARDKPRKRCETREHVCVFLQTLAECGKRVIQKRSF